MGLWLKLIGLVQRSAATWRCAAFISVMIMDHVTALLKLSEILWLVSWLIARGSAVYHCTSSSLMCVSVNRYITSAWQLNCVGSSAVSCQQGSNLTQRFTVSSSVNFILVPDTTPQPPTTWVHCHHVERWTLFIRQVSGWDKSGAN